MALLAVGAENPLARLLGESRDDGERRGVADSGAESGGNQVSGKQIRNDDRQDEMKAEERGPGQSDPAGKAGGDRMGRRAQPQQSHPEIAE